MHGGALVSLSVQPLRLLLAVEVRRGATAGHTSPKRVELAGPLARVKLRVYVHLVDGAVPSWHARGSNGAQSWFCALESEA